MGLKEAVAAALSQGIAATQLDELSPTQTEGCADTVPEEASPISTPAKKSRKSSSPAKTDPYPFSPSPAQSELADAALKKQLGSQEALSVTLQRLSDPKTLPPFLEQLQVGYKLTDMPEEVQARMLSTYSVFLQPAHDTQEKEC